MPELISWPAPHVGYQRMADYAQGGDFEGVFTYGIGITWPVEHSNPQIAVRAYEVERVTASGQHRYTVAIDADASNHTWNAGMPPLGPTTRSVRTSVPATGAGALPTVRSRGGDHCY